jgi:ESCRT-II complex subunit VPS22
LAVVQTLLSDFRTHLQEFAVKHRGRINSDPEFRRDFHQLCVTTGVDPLASSKGLFADVLGLGQFYFELGVGVVEICMKTRSRNGGVIPVHHVTAALNAGRKGQQHAVADTDVVRAVEKLAVLGNGYRILLQVRAAWLILSHALIDLDDTNNSHTQRIYRATGRR